MNQRPFKDQDHGHRRLLLRLERNQRTRSGQLPRRLAEVIDHHKLESQISSKQEALSSAKTDEEKSEIRDSLSKLRASLAKLKAQMSQIEATENAAKTAAQAPTAEQAKPALMSGESEKISTSNYDENTPFGERYAYV